MKQVNNLAYLTFPVGGVLFVKAQSMEMLNAALS